MLLLFCCYVDARGLLNYTANVCRDSMNEIAI